jgi:hypothetical protein
LLSRMLCKSSARSAPSSLRPRTLVQILTQQVRATGLLSRLLRKSSARSYTTASSETFVSRRSRGTLSC